MSTEERRAPGATRIPFDALVEVGGALGPTFEAQAVNVSGDGIQLRTAYLPEPGQPLTCRFDAGPNQSVLASGEVVWAQGADRGGEFGVRFTDVDAESVESLKRVCGLVAAFPGIGVQSGSKVRLHIDGLAAPMRAKIKDADATAVTVGSDLGFLQVGRQVELEDTQSGGKRPASIHRVDIALDPASQVPQLIVTLRYSDSPEVEHMTGGASHGGSTGTPRAEPGARPTERTDDLEAMDQASAQMKGFFVRGIQNVGPALRRFAARAKNTVAILGKRQSERWSEGSLPRRTTAAPPGGGLHAEGRRVLRGQSSVPSADPVAAPAKGSMTKRRAVLAGGVMIAAILGALALKKMHHESAQEAAALATAASASASAAAAASAPAPSVAPVASVALSVSGAPAAPSASSPPASPVAENEETEASQPHKKRVHVAPFANGPVHHGNILRLKMDGPVETIEGAQQPTGFAVKIPGRKSVEAAAPLASRDSRIATIKVSNDAAGAELTVAFKDGVPNYRVSARGDTLVIALAPPGAVTPTVAKKDESGGRNAKHKHAHEQTKSEQEL